MMKGKISRGIFLVPWTGPWVSQWPGLVCTELLLLAVMARTFLSCGWAVYLDWGVQRNLRMATSSPAMPQAAMISRSWPARPVPEE
jgi:hypothetical protein